MEIDAMHDQALDTRPGSALNQSNQDRSVRLAPASRALPPRALASNRSPRRASPIGCGVFDREQSGHIAERPPATRAIGRITLNSWYAQPSNQDKSQKSR